MKPIRKIRSCNTLTDALFISAQMSAPVTKRQHGDHYENLAYEYLLNEGCRILTQNFSVKSGELDLIAEEERSGKITLVIVEVRKKDQDNWIRPEESITYAKKQRILSATQIYLQRYRGKATDLRLDLIAFTGDQIRHFKNFINAE